MSVFMSVVVIFVKWYTHVMSNRCKLMLGSEYKYIYYGEYSRKIFRPVIKYLDVLLVYL